MSTHNPVVEAHVSEDSCLSADSSSNDSRRTALHWFRRGLRFHDNPALSESLKSAQKFRCIYIIDPSTINASSKVEINKWRFLLESLNDLDSTLRKHNSRLYVLKGQPTFILPILFKDWHVGILSIEEDPTPYGSKRDEAIGLLAHEHGVYVIKRTSQTLHSLSKLVDLCEGKKPKNLKQFAVIFQAAGAPPYYLQGVPFDLLSFSSSLDDYDAQYAVPSLMDLGLHEDAKESIVWHGGETEALRRLAYHLERRAWVACFDRPKLDKRSLMACHSSLGPYLKFGCLSPRLLYWKVDELYRQVNGSHVDPPLSLHGQLMLREYHYLMSHLYENFSRAQGNPLCLQIPWKKVDATVMNKLVQGTTGFPWIDAIVKQLIREGWIHGIAKQALISFITYGQLFFSWEEAANLLDKYYLEGDICTISGEAMMLSGSLIKRALPSNVTSPVLSGQEVDPGADFIRHYLPILKSYPSKYIYEPWTAPLGIQQQAGCIIGQDYPAPIMDHYHTLHSNMLVLQQFMNALMEKHTHRRYSRLSLGSTSQSISRHLISTQSARMHSSNPPY